MSRVALLVIAVAPFVLTVVSFALATMTAAGPCPPADGC